MLPQISFEVFPLTLHQLSQPSCSSLGILMNLAGQALLLCSDGAFVHSARRGCVITALVLVVAVGLHAGKQERHVVKLKHFPPLLFSLGCN